jgi:hypothetical protein
MFSPIIIGGSEEKRPLWLEVLVGTIIPATITILFQKTVEEVSDYYKRKRDKEEDKEHQVLIVEGDDGEEYCLIDGEPYPIERPANQKKKTSHDKSKKRELDTNSNGKKVLPT